MRALFVALIWFALAGLAVAQPTVTHQGGGVSSGGTTTTMTVTADAGDIVYACASVGVTSSHGTPSLSIAGGALTWTSRQSQSGTGNPGDIAPITVQCWQAPAPAGLSASTITITSTETIDDAATAWLAVSGYSATTFDPNANTLVKAAHGFNATPTQPQVSPYSTSLANDLLIGIVATNSLNFSTGIAVNSTPFTNGSCETHVTAGGTNYGAINLCYLRVTATQSGTTLQTSSGNTVTSWVILGDAITADTPVTGRSRLIQ